MNISREEASAALDSIHEADRKVAQRRSYAYAAPFLILWGLVWALCNGVSDLAPRWSDRAWMAGNVLGAAVSIYLIVALVLRERRTCTNRAASREMGRRFALLGIACWSYFIAMFLVLGPMTGRRTGVFVSLFWTIAYMAAGAWIGARLSSSASSPPSPSCWGTCSSNSISRCGWRCSAAARSSPAACG